MTTLNTITRFLNKELRTSKIADHSRNGLQVRGKKEVKKIVFGVDACMELAVKAKKEKADLIIVHHGLLWKRQEDKGGLRKKVVSFLKKNKISLYASHLPLDLHPIYGNNKQLCNITGIDIKGTMGKYHGIYIGMYGTLKTGVASLTNKLNKKLKTKCIVHNFGKKQVKKIAVVSGCAPDLVVGAKQIGCDTFITGEAMHSHYHVNKELAMNVIHAGHYATETLGVKALEKLLKTRFKLKTKFVDIPTNL